MPESKSRKAEGTTSGGSRAPYESAINTAFHKLTSEILIFLLAYAVLLAGLGLSGQNISPQVLTALEVVPVLGAGAYVLLSKRRVTKSGSGVEVRAGIASGEAYVGGVRGTDKVSGPVKVDAGIAGGKAKVVGVDVGDSARTGSQTADAEYLMTIFQRLPDRGKRKLIDAARGLEDQADERPAQP